MKKILSLLFTLIFFCIAAVSVNAAETEDLTIRLKINSPLMLVNNEEKTIDENGTSPVIVNSRTLLPVRAVVEEIGGSVEWDADTKTVALQSGDNNIKLQIDSTTAYLNNEPHTLDTPPAIIGGRTMLPIRFIAESFGLEVNWNGEEQTVTIVKRSDIQTSEETTTESTTVERATSAETTTQIVTAEETTTQSDNNILVVYFSATNNTKGVAEKIAEATGGDIYAITPAIPYTPEDLDYNSECRANKEQNDDSARPEISGSVENMEDYDTVFIGYPIWWGEAPKIMYTFVESYDLDGKTIIPFCTSGSSPIGSSAENMQKLADGAKWLEGRRFSGGASADEVSGWVNSLGLE